MSDAIPADTWMFGGRYRVDAPIGSGGMGDVWSGYDEQLDRRVAIKLMRTAGTPAFRPSTAEAEMIAAAAEVDRERFLREIRTTARLELPGIPAVYDFGTDEATGRIYLVMQLVYGQTLADMITARDYGTDPWPTSWAAAIGAQVAATLVDVHRVDVVHRDIKPSNLIISPSGLVKILDFGVAILQGAGALPKLTHTGMTVGSPPYMSREQVLGNPVGPASDVYALGCVLHEMVTGRVPFAETGGRSLLDHHVNTPAQSMMSLRADVPAGLDDLVLAMLAKMPSDRPTAEQVYDALLPLARSGPPPGPVDRDPRRPFLRPLGPSPRNTPDSPPRPPVAPGAPLTLDEAQDIRDRVADLIQASQFQRAIDILEEAADRAAHDPVLELEMKIELATTLYVADEFSRAARILDAILPLLEGMDGLAELHYYAGISHAEIGDVQPAIGYLTAFVGETDPQDRLYRDAIYQLGMMLPAIGRVDEGLHYLETLRPLLAAEYGADSLYVRTLDQRIDQIRRAP